MKNVGRQAVDQISAQREARGGFRDVSDFARAINPRLVNKRALETLASAGAMDELGIDRATAFPMSIASWPRSRSLEERAKARRTSSPARQARRRQSQLRPAKTLGPDR